MEAGARGSPTRRPYHVTKPVSRVLYPARGDGHSSRARLAACLMQPTRAAHLKADWQRFPAPTPPLFGLAPGGVCRAVLVTKNAVRSYRTLSPLPLGPSPVLKRRFAFCGTVPGVAPAGGYPAPCFHGARTFLSALIRNAGEAAIRPADKGNIRGLRGQLQVMISVIFVTVRLRIIIEYN